MHDQHQPKETLVRVVKAEMSQERVWGARPSGSRPAEMEFVQYCRWRSHRKTERPWRKRTITS